MFFLALIGFSAQTFWFDVDEYLASEPYEDVFDDVGSSSAEENSDIWKILADITTNDDPEENLVQSIMESLWFQFWNENPVLLFVNNLINFALVVVGLIAMVALLYGFYSMFFGKAEEAYEEAKKIVLNATIALVVIWLAWFLVSWAFNLFFAAAGQL